MGFKKNYLIQQIPIYQGKSQHRTIPIHKSFKNLSKALKSEHVTGK
jgi:hypothetical protein